MRLVPLVLALLAAICWGEERLLVGPLPSLIDTIDWVMNEALEVSFADRVQNTSGSRKRLLFQSRIHPLGWLARPIEMVIQCRLIKIFSFNSLIMRLRD